MMVNEEKENWYLVSSFWGPWTNSTRLGLKQTSILYDMFLKKKKKNRNLKYCLVSDQKNWSSKLSAALMPSVLCCGVNSREMADH